MSYFNSMSDERTPLLRDQEDENNPHKQFCMLVGVPPSNLAEGASFHTGRKTLYGRASRHRRRSNLTYQFVSSVSNTLLLSQVVLGAALTGLGASSSSHVLITIFGAMNTIIAGLVAYLKVEANQCDHECFGDDLERVIDEIENSEIMWLGISQGIHGYDEIDIDDAVTVRKEVARLTRLYDRAVRDHTLNNPDMYMAGGSGDGTATALRARPVPAATALPPTGAATAAPAIPTGEIPVTTTQTPAAPIADPDESPATAAPKPSPPPPTAPTNTDAPADAPKEDPPKVSAEEDAKDTPSASANAETKDEPIKETPKADSKDPAPTNAISESKEEPAESSKDAESKPINTSQPYGKDSSKDLPDDTSDNKE